MRKIVLRFGSLQRAETAALSVPGFGDEIALVNAQLSLLAGPPARDLARENLPFVVPRDDMFARPLEWQRLQERKCELVLAALEHLQSLAGDAGSEAKKPRHRPPGAILRSTVKDLLLALEQRRAELQKLKREGRKKLPDGSEFAQEAIGARVGLHRMRVQQAEELLVLGWDLLKSRPDFPADGDFVYWPSVREASRLLASRSAEK